MLCKFYQTYLVYEFLKADSSASQLNFGYCEQLVNTVKHTPVPAFSHRTC